MYTVNKSFIALCLVLQAIPSYAQTNGMGELVLDYLAGKANKTKPVAVQLEPDSWGAPSRKNKLDKGYDERFIDERTSGIALRDLGATEKQKIKSPRYSSKQTPDYYTSASCTGVTRAWEGASSYAVKGMEDKAYQAYLKLLSTCNKDSELIGTIHQAKLNLSPEALQELLDEPVMASPKLQNATYHLQSQVLFKTKINPSNEPQVLAMARGLKDQAYAKKDVKILEALAWLEHRANKPTVAEKLFRDALKMEPDSISLREGLATVLLAKGNLDSAWKEAEKTGTDKGEAIKAGVKTSMARKALSEEEFNQALSYAEEASGYENSEELQALKAWALKGKGDAKKAAAIFKELYENNPSNKDYAQGYVASLQANSELTTLKKLAMSRTPAAPLAADAVSETLLSQGRDIQATPYNGQAPSSSISTEIATRTKSGKQGEGKMSLTSAPTAKATIKTEYGTLSTEISQVTVSNSVHRASGGVAEIKYESAGDSGIYVGVTGSSVGKSQIGGEIGAKSWQDTGFTKIGFSRKGVYDSLRSIAGEGNTGPTTKNQLELVTNHKVSPKWTLETATALGMMATSGGKSNNFFEHDSSMLYNLNMKGMSYLAVGPTLHAGVYSEDQNRFEQGFGGYYSPESDIGFGLKGYAQTEEGKDWLIKGNAKILYANRSFYDSSISTPALEGNITGGMLLSDHVIGLAGLAIKASSGYNDTTGWVGISVPFSQKAKLRASDLGTMPAINSK